MNLTRIISIKERIAISEEFRPDERDFILQAINAVIINAAARSSSTETIEARETCRIEHDDFEGEIIGRYTTREGKRGVVLQQTGTRVVHVYGEKWLK